MNSKLWIIGYLFIVLGALGGVGSLVYTIDPFFHYHKPNTEKYYYTINNQRSQNDGIIKHFEYDALITGTSMTENFKTSEMDSIFGTNSIKVPYSGGSYKEINDCVETALKHNSSVKIIVRGLDQGNFFVESNKLRSDLGTYPTYLYDNNPFNDVQYLFNKDVVLNRIYPMLQNQRHGITSFDTYSNWQKNYTFGINTVCPNGIAINNTTKNVIHLTDEDKAIIHDNIYKNVTSLAEKYPQVTFYYFFTPYSIVWWLNQVSTGNIYRQIEAEQYTIEMILKCDNIKLYSFDNRTDIITDLNNYKDNIHYGQWINSLMLKWMYEGQYLLTKDNYNEYIQEKLSFYTSFNYLTLAEQEDYEADLLADALLNKELSDIEPMDLLADERQLNLSGALLIADQYDGNTGIECNGRLECDVGSLKNLSEYLINSEYIGAKIAVTDIDNYKY